MSTSNSGPQPDGFASIDDVAHLLVPADGICWWCRSQPASTGEHKFKRSSLSRLMGDGQLLIWGTGDAQHDIRGKSGITRDRYGVIKFPKSMCGTCNNDRSKPLDDAYDRYSEYVESTWLRVMPGFDLEALYGATWQDQAYCLARYHAKHFGCRMVKIGLPVPQSLRDFLNGADDMTDTQMSIISTDSVHRTHGSGLSISPDFASTDRDMTCFVSYVMAAYIGPIGVRYEWRDHGMQPEQRSQFFHYPGPVN